MKSPCQCADCGKPSKPIAWSLGHWFNCQHFNPHDSPDKHVEKKMFPQAKARRERDHQWGVVNPGNAICAAIFRRQADANQYRREKAGAYVVVPVIITPIYTQTAAGIPRQ